MSNLRRVTLGLLFCLNTTAHADIQAPVAAEPPAPGPRAVHWCAAMLSKSPFHMPVREMHRKLRALARTSDQWTNGERMVQFKMAIAAVNGRTLRPGNIRNFSARQIIYGDDAIREYLVGVDALAGELDRDYRPADATRPFNYLPRIHSHAWNLVRNSYAFAAFIMLSHLSYTAGYWPVAAVGTLMSTGVAMTQIVPPIRAMLADVRNEYKVRRPAGRAPAGVPRAGRDLDQSGPNFAREVLARLDGPESLRHETAFVTYRTDLPLSASASDLAYVRRLAPTADELIAAVNQSGEFPLPADKRSLEITQIYFYDGEEKQTALGVFAWDRKLPTDWKHWDPARR